MRSNSISENHAWLGIIGVVNRILDTIRKFPLTALQNTIYAPKTASFEGVEDEE